MQDLKPSEKEFLEYIRDNHYINKSKGYVYFQDKKTKKKYKRGRVLMQLHLNKKFEMIEHVHHKDNNKQNDDIINLEVLKDCEHNSLTHAGIRGRKYKPRIKTNKLNQQTINKIFELYKKTSNYSEIARKLNISNNAVRQYILGK